MILSLFRYTQIFIETNYNTLVVELYFYRNLEGLKMGSELPWSMYPICLFDNDNVMGLLLSITYCKVFSYLKYGDLFTKFNCVVICALSLRVSSIFSDIVNASKKDKFCTDPYNFKKITMVFL